MIVRPKISKKDHTSYVPKNSEGVWIILYSSPYKLKTALGRRVGGGEVKRLFIEGYTSARDEARR